MKEKIYTIPVTEAFGEDCECPLCLLQEKLENDYTDYYLGPALMEPDCRVETNKRGFCRRHFEMLYNRQENRLGLALETDTHMREQIEKLKEAAGPIISGGAGSRGQNAFLSVLSGRFSSRDQSGSTPAAKLVKMLSEIDESCTVCGRLERTMERYLDVVTYLWSGEADFRKLFSEKKGFCLLHFKMLVEASEKHLNDRENEQFLNMLVQQQLENMDRMEKELDWFTKKFDYRYNDAPWGNSKDALPRSIQKLKGYSSLK